MIGTELGNLRGEELLRLVSALGRHRYVVGRMHLVHLFAIEAAGELGEATEWARRVRSGGIDVASKDERLLRQATDAELVAVLTAFWGTDDAPRARLAELLAGIDATRAATPFDEETEEDAFPRLVDAGWELVPLAALDAERHKGAIQSFDVIDFDVAKFEEENAVPPAASLHELPLLGATELLDAFAEDGTTRAPFVIWEQGHPTYLDYVLRGVLKAAKLEV